MSRSTGNWMVNEAVMYKSRAFCCRSCNSSSSNICPFRCETCLSLPLRSFAPKTRSVCMPLRYWELFFSIRHLFPSRVCWLHYISAFRYRILQINAVRTSTLKKKLKKNFPISTSDPILTSGPPGNSRYPACPIRPC